MTAEKFIYVVRHGQTYFNKLARMQGWCDTPLTPEGAENIRALGRGLQHVTFSDAFSSDAGRTQATTRLILDENKQTVPLVTIEPKLREWGFGSWEGRDETLFFNEVTQLQKNDPAQLAAGEPISFEALADAIGALDTEGWSETYPDLKQRTWDGFLSLAAAAQGENTLVVSHGLTIALFLSFIQPDVRAIGLANGSVTKLRFAAGQFELLELNSLAYMEAGQ